MKTHPLFIVAILCTALSGACAALQAPVDTPPATKERSPGLDPLEIDADGLRLELIAPSATADEELQIWQRIDGGQWTHLQSISITEELAPLLNEGNVELRVPLRAPPADLEFKLHHIGPDGRRHSAPLSMSWPGWPDIPELFAEAGDHDRPAVDLSWAPFENFEARVLRRDVLADSPYQGIAIVHPSAGGRLVDADVGPGDLYSYRVQFVDMVDGIRRVHPYSPSIYVALPD